LSKIDFGVQPRAPTYLPYLPFFLSVRPPFIIFLYPLLLPHTLLPILLSSTSAYYLRRRALPTVCYQTAEATSSPLLKVRAYIGIIVILLTISNNPAIDA